MASAQSPLAKQVQAILAENARLRDTLDAGGLKQYRIDNEKKANEALEKDANSMADRALINYYWKLRHSLGKSATAFFPMKGVAPEEVDKCKDVFRRQGFDLYAWTPTAVNYIVDRVYRGQNDYTFVVSDGTLTVSGGYIAMDGTQAPASVYSQRGNLICEFGAKKG